MEKAGFNGSSQPSIKDTDLRSNLPDNNDNENQGKSPIFDESFNIHEDSNQTEPDLIMQNPDTNILISSKKPFIVKKDNLKILNAKLGLANKLKQDSDKENLTNNQSNQ